MRAVLVDLNILEVNIKDMFQQADEAGVKLRSHVKVHESALIAKLQLEAGAYAVEVGPKPNDDLDWPPVSYNV